MRPIVRLAWAREQAVRKPRSNLVGYSFKEVSEDCGRRGELRGPPVSVRAMAPFFCFSDS